MQSTGYFATIYRFGVLICGPKNRVFDIKSGHDFCRYRNSIQVIYFQISVLNKLLSLNPARNRVQQCWTTLLTTLNKWAAQHYLILFWTTRDFLPCKRHSPSGQTTRLSPLKFRVRSPVTWLEPSPSYEMSIVNALPKVVGFLRVLRFPPTGKVDRVIGKNKMSVLIRETLTITIW